MLNAALAWKKTAPKITQVCLHANAFLNISGLLTHACTLLCISALPVHTLSQVYGEALGHRTKSVFEPLEAQ